MLVDSHCHLDFPDFAEDLDGVLARASEAGVGAMVTICTRVRRFPQVQAIAQRYSQVFCTVGTHPHNAAEEADVDYDEILSLAANDDVVGIGEAGLDYHYDNAPRDLQERGFRVHIAVARSSGLPLVIHARNADDDIARILAEESERGTFPFVLHCFSSGRALAEAGIALGGYVSFSGILAFRNSDALREIASDIPLDRLLVETDAPYLAPPPHRGRRNEPAFVVNTAQVLAAVKRVSPEELADRTTENFFRLFSRARRPHGS